MVADIKVTRVEHGLNLEGDLGKAELRIVGPGVVHVVYEGLAYADFVPYILDVVDPELPADALSTLFVDAYALRSYETGFRQAWATWLKANESRLNPTVILFGSKLVHMGIALVNVVLRQPIVAVSEHADFDRRLQAALVAAR